MYYSVRFFSIFYFYLDHLSRLPISITKSYSGSQCWSPSSRPCPKGTSCPIHDAERQFHRRCSRAGQFQLPGLISCQLATGNRPTVEVSRNRFGSNVTFRWGKLSQSPAAGGSCVTGRWGGWALSRQNWFYDRNHLHKHQSSLRNMLH